MAVPCGAAKLSVSAGVSVSSAEASLRPASSVAKDSPSFCVRVTMTLGSNASTTVVSSSKYRTTTLHGSSFEAIRRLRRGDGHVHVHS